MNRSAIALLAMLAMPLAGCGQEEFGTPHPEAPAELAAFAFLIGDWTCESRIKGADGEYQTYPATWVGRYVMDGYVIADEFRQFDANGNLTQLGTTYRSYNTERGAWTMKWLDALNSIWLDLGPEELGGVEVSDTSVVFKHYLPEGPAREFFPTQTIFRITFHDISRDSFRWKAEVSTDEGASWEQVQAIEARRTDGGRK